MTVPLSGGSFSHSQTMPGFGNLVLSCVWTSSFPSDKQLSLSEFRGERQRGAPGPKIPFH